ncbi:MAG: hypothetical protein M1831_006367 [Alyxoria varia]|nr:MAG: hypothetical protein M1831_006367 [Alyxoria varia]
MMKPFISCLLGVLGLTFAQKGPDEAPAATNAESSSSDVLDPVTHNHVWRDDEQAAEQQASSESGSGVLEALLQKRTNSDDEWFSSAGSRRPLLVVPARKRRKYEVQSLEDVLRPERLYRDEYDDFEQWLAEDFQSRHKEESTSQAFESFEDWWAQKRQGGGREALDPQLGHAAGHDREMLPPSEVEFGRTDPTITPAVESAIPVADVTHAPSRPPKNGPVPAHPPTMLHTVKGSNWFEHRPPLDVLDEYPSGQEVDELLDKIQSRFFNRFRATLFPVKSFRRRIRFGGPQGDKYTCRIAWLNPSNLRYPWEPDLYPEGTAFPNFIAASPKDHLVEHDAFDQQYYRKTVESPRPTQPGPNVWNYDRFTSPTVMHYFEMRLLARTRKNSNYEKDKRRAGMSAILESVDGHFGLGFRVYMSQSGMPRDNHRTRVTQPEKGNTKLVKSLIEYIWLN